MSWKVFDPKMCRLAFHDESIVQAVARSSKDLNSQSIRPSAPTKPSADIDIFRISFLTCVLRCVGAVRACRFEDDPSLGGEHQWFRQPGQQFLAETQHLMEVGAYA